jgi:type IV pilus assembly protein PilV
MSEKRMNKTTEGLQQSGFSLIEVLFGMLILAIGILGMVSMQINSKRIGHDALQRSIATNLAQDMIERMRINRTELGSYVGASGISSGAITLGGAAIATSKPSSDCTISTCTPAELAAYDLWEWERSMRGAGEISAEGNLVGGLVNPTACITHNRGLITLAVAWDAFQSLGNPFEPAQCGVGLGLYGDDDEERQVVYFTTLIFPGLYPTE